MNVIRSCNSQSSFFHKEGFHSPNWKRELFIASVLASIYSPGAYSSQMRVHSW